MRGWRREAGGEGGRGKEEGGGEGEGEGGLLGRHVLPHYCILNCYLY